MRKRKNPMFNYKEFKAKRERLAELLISYFETPTDEGRVAIKELLVQGRDAIELLKYGTPFHLDVLRDSFVNIYEEATSKDIVQPKLALDLARDILACDEDKDVRYVKWFVDSIVDCYRLQKDNKIASVLNVLETIDKNFNFVFPNRVIHIDEFKKELSDAIYKSISSTKGTVSHFFFSFYTHQGEHAIECETEYGFLGVAYCYLFLSILNSLYENDLDVDFRPLFKITDFGKTDDTKGVFVGDLPHYTFDSKKTPFWISSLIDEIDFFNINIHFTNFDFTKRITPTNLATKLTDYTESALFTYLRDYPTVTKRESRRALVYGWHKDHIRTHSKARSSFGIRDIDIYGPNIFYLFSNATISFYKMTDSEIQTVVLLQDVVDVIPCFIGDEYAYFGLSADKKEPLFKIKCSSRDAETPIVTYVLDEICKFLESSEYRIEDNINQTKMWESRYKYK